VKSVLQYMDQSTCAVIVSFNDLQQLLICVSSVLPNVTKVVVIDNNSDERIQNDILSIYQKEITYIQNSCNMGIGYAFNQGIKYSISNGYKWTLLLDQDSVLSEQMVQRMLDTYNKQEEYIRKKTVLLVPRILEKNNAIELPALLATRAFSKKIKSPQDMFIHFQISSGSLLKNELVSKIGLMNEKLFIDCVDYDYCFRVLDNNFLILRCGNAFMHHSLGKANTRFNSKFTEHSASRVYYQTRNGLFIIYKYGRKYRSIAYAEAYRLIRKIPKIIFFESNKAEKIKMYFRGIKDFILYHKNLEQH